MPQQLRGRARPSHRSSAARKNPLGEDMRSNRTSPPISIQSTATLPQLLTSPRWVCWETGSKAPINPSTGRYARSNAFTTWGTLPQALSYDPSHIGYVLGDGYGCIDLDEAFTPDGILTPGAQEIVNLYPGNIIEVSPSGNGLHIWGLRAPLPGIKRTWKNQPVELYSKGRYITVTGGIYQPGKLLPL